LNKSAKDKPILYTENLIKGFRRRTVVDGVSIELDAGEVVGLLGANGAGKTTTFSMVVGLLQPTSGRIFLNGEDVTRYPMYKRARRGMAYLAQEPSVFRDLTARQNIEVILEHLKVPKAERREHTDRLLEELDITHIANSKAYKSRWRICSRPCTT
jgi:lipopolysaccharide export system ATP-binding protein